MDKEQAYKIGLAFKLGMIYAKGKAHARKLTTDKAEWITVHPNGKENKGRPALIDSTTGQVLGGMGGKFNGKHISIANSKSNKPALLNNQKMGFYDVEKEQDKTTSQYLDQSTKANLNQNEIMFNSLVRNFGNGGDVDLNYWLKNIDTKTPDVKKIVTPKEVYERKDGKWINSKGEQLYTAQMENQIYNDFKEFRKSSDYGSDEHANRIENEYLLSRGKDLDPKTVEKIEKKKEQINKLKAEYDANSSEYFGGARTLAQQRGNATRYSKMEKLRNDIKDLETKLRDKGAEERANANNQPANKADALIGNIKNKKDLQATYKKDFNLETSSENRADRVPANWSINDIKNKTQQLEQAIKDIDTEKAKIKNAYSGFKDADSKNKLAKEYNNLKSQQSFFKDRIDDMQERFNQLYDNQSVTNQSVNNAKQQVQNLLNKNKVSFNGYDFNNISEAKDFLYDADKNIRGHKEDIKTNTAKLKQANKDLAKLQTLDRFYQDYKKDNPLFEKSFTEYLKDNKANYKGIRANELPDLRSSKYWGGGYQDSERAINTLKNAYERVSDNLKRKNTEIRDLNRNIEYAKERIPRLQKLIKMGNETLSKIEK